MSDWIKVEDQLPKESVPVWVTDGKEIFIAEYCYFNNEGWFWCRVYDAPTKVDSKHWTYGSELDDDYSDIIAWHSFPKLPNQEGDTDE